MIRCDLTQCGLFALFMYVLDHIAIAEERGYIPVVDARQFELYKCKEMNNENVWELFFEQINDQSFEDILKNENYVLSRVGFPMYKGLYYYRTKPNILPKKEQVAELNSIVKRYIKIKQNILNDVDPYVEKLKSNKRTLGIHIRGTDMYRQKGEHPRPSEKIKDIGYIKNIMNKHKIDHIFLCTDTEKNIDMFRKEFGNRVFFTKALRQRDDSYTGVHRDERLNKKRQYHNFLLGKEVIIDMLVLSKCTVLLCGPSNVSFAAMIYNNNQYEEIYYH